MSNSCEVIIWPTDDQAILCVTTISYDNTGAMEIGSCTWPSLTYSSLTDVLPKPAWPAIVNIDHPAECVFTVTVVYYGCIEVRFYHWRLCRQGWYKWYKYVTWTFALWLPAALKPLDIKELLKEITRLNREECADMSDELQKHLRSYNDALTARVAQI